MIGNATQKGSMVYVYDEKGRLLFTKPAGLSSRPNDGLHGYTSNTLSIRIGPNIHIYNDKGILIRSISA